MQEVMLRYSGAEKWVSATTKSDRIIGDKIIRRRGCLGGSPSDSDDK